MHCCASFMSASCTCGTRKDIQTRLSSNLRPATRECVHLVTRGHFRVARQRWRSHHSIRHNRKPHAARKLHGSVFYRTGVISDGRFTLREYGFWTFLAPVTLTLTQWPSYTNLTRVPWRLPDVRKWTAYVKAFEVIIWHTDTDRQTLPKLYTTPLRGWSKIIDTWHLMKSGFLGKRFQLAHALQRTSETIDSSRRWSL